MKNNYEVLVSMSIDELADWLDKNGIPDCSPWMNWFSEKYCEKCPSVFVELNSEQFGNIRSEECYCENSDKCRFFEELDSMPSCKDVIKMWLQNDAE